MMQVDNITCALTDMEVTEQNDMEIDQSHLKHNHLMSQHHRTEKKNTTI